MASATATPVNLRGRPERLALTAEGGIQGESKRGIFVLGHRHTIDDCVNAIIETFASSNCLFASGSSSQLRSFELRELPMGPQPTSEVSMTYRLWSGIECNFLGTDTGVSPALSPSETFPAIVRRFSDKIVAAPADDPLGIGKRLDSFKEMEDGWADGVQPAVDWGNGYGTAPSVEGLDWLKGQFVSYYQRNLPKPHIFPMPDGGVIVEWHIGPQRAGLEIDLDTHHSEWHCLNFSTGDNCEQDLALDTPQAWEWLIEKLRQLEAATA